jgi:hypothetical protein
MVTAFCLTAWGSTPGVAATFDRLQASFELPQVKGNAFDFKQNDVQVSFTTPQGDVISVPAFFDGGQTWRVRLTPTAPGKYSVSRIALNGQDAHPQNLQPAEFTVTGSSKPGFVRIDPHNKMRFVFDDGSPYYPVGYDLGWHYVGEPAMPALPVSLGRMGKAGVNWTRIWMCYWDGKNLDWQAPPEQQVAPGTLSLSTARQWDAIVEAAQANDVHFQMVLQHHGQYSTHADANWQLNPWNKANGGWLDSPVQFFTDPKAIALTKSKFRYIIARWGYSPAIMAWELFNEVESTDAFEKNLDAVAAWHEQMAKFIREQDHYKHLITTSSRVSEPKIWTATDYYQPHTYPPDVLAGIASLENDKLDRAYFYGEIGGGGDGPGAAAGTLHKALWASLMSGSSGAAQYWFWYFVEPDNLLFHYTSAQKFIAQSHLLAQSGMEPVEVAAQTPQRGPLRFGPGMDWAPSKTTVFDVTPAGFVKGLGGMSAYLQGTGHNHAMFPNATFNVDYPEAGKFTVRFDEMTPDGAGLQVTLDGQRLMTLTLNAPRSFGGGAEGNGANRPRPNPRMDEALEIPIAAGKHTIRLDNTGLDWLHIRDFTLDPYTSELGVLGKANKDLLVLWVYKREQAKNQSVSGTLELPGREAGTYRIVWWDPYKGQIIREDPLSVSEGSPATVTTPPVTSDLAAWVERSAATASQ